MENTAVANSIIRDTDFAAEITNLARASVMQMSSLNALAWTNSERGRVAELLG